MNTQRAATRISFCALALAASIAAAASSPPTEFLEIAEGRIAFDDTKGFGPLVIAIPGMGDLRGEYRFLRPALVEAGYRLVTMDVRGHGESSVAREDYSARAIGHDALALIDHLNVGTAIIIGTLFAAGAALWAADTAPSRVKGVVLFGPIVRDLPQSFFANAALNVGLPGHGVCGFGRLIGTVCFPPTSPTIIAAIARC
jgi:pimeloyl-ACP methyl ester carboxylesterase